MLSHVQILLSEKVLQALVIGVDITFVSDQIVSLDLQGVHNSCKLKIMGRVALLVVLQLVGSISYDSPILHQNTNSEYLSHCGIVPILSPFLKKKQRHSQLAQPSRSSLPLTRRSPYPEVTTSASSALGPLL